ncbi:MAG TPA: sensor histidine kinase [Flavobacterium sp.]|nr:sensor histidine kinase [Flavobacterium sp.]
MLAVLFTAGMAFSQHIQQAQHLYENYQYNKALIRIAQTDTTSLSQGKKADYYNLKGLINSKLNNADVACEHLIQAQRLYNNTDQIDKAQHINLELTSIISSQNTKYESSKYINDYLKYAKESDNPLYLARAYKALGSINVGEDSNASIRHFKKALYYNRKAGDAATFSQIYNNLGVVYNEMLKKPDSGLFFLKKAQFYDRELDDANGVCYNYVNQASSYFQFGDYHKAIDLLHLADKAPIREYYKKTKSIIYVNLADAYKKVGNFKDALHYSELYSAYTDSINEHKQNLAINEIMTKYQTKDKAMENLALKSRLQRNRALNYTFMFFFFVSLFVIVLGYKNMLKKKKIAEQGKMIETQKLEKALKDQELHEIDLMLESQEKERQRIANELHDDLGSMLTTLKINFQHLKRQHDNNVVAEDVIYIKTDDLLEEAYQKVRNIAHLKNLGIIGTEGLLNAVKAMAEKMSVINQLKINVFPYGLNERLENQKEIVLFRMIQEICHNIIKHSGATEANIYLTQHSEKELNIIVEDNGKGFDSKKISHRHGIGLRNIEKKTEQMGGTFTIDSVPGKGTTIIIDVPI